MRVYNDAGNMCNNQAALISENSARVAGKLFDDLFLAGMPIIEARALLGYFKSELDTAIVLSILHHQLEAISNAKSTDG
jgi:hypothetical protein